jgi:hypothetical protein
LEVGGGSVQEAVGIKECLVAKDGDTYSSMKGGTGNRILEVSNGRTAAGGILLL